MTTQEAWLLLAIGSAVTLTLTTAIIITISTIHDTHKANRANRKLNQDKDTP